MARAPAVAEIDTAPEADRLEGFPHPRETHTLYGHAAAERTLTQITDASKHAGWVNLS